MMLRSISINNFILIDNLNIDFKLGFTAITGQTGAGKSLIFTALNFVLGARANAKLIKNQQKQASVCIEFSVNNVLLSMLAQKGIDAQNEIIIRRTISPDGRSRVYINDTLTTLSTVEQLAEYLIEFCGQHSHRGLMDCSTHVGIIDQYGGITEQAVMVRDLYIAWKNIEKQVMRLEEQRHNILQEQSYLKYVVDELQSLDVQEDEEEQLVARRKILQQHDRIKTTLHDTVNTLGQGQILENLYVVQKSLEKFPEIFSQQQQNLNGIVLELEEFQNSLAGFSLEEAAGDLEQLEDRLFTIRDAARKYNIPSVQLSAFLVEKQKRLEFIDNSHIEIGKLNQERDQAKQCYIDAAKKLFIQRKQISLNLEESVTKELEVLEMSKAGIKVQIEELSEEKFSAQGLEKIKFQVKTNEGMGYHDMTKTASGGELARLMLAFKVVINKVKQVPTIIFDEVDTGVSGSVSDSIGKKIKEISQNSQVLAITHQPQVASYSDNHILVEKYSDNDNTQIMMSELVGGDKTTEIARMISGKEITNESVAAAQSLIKKAIA